MIEEVVAPGRLCVVLRSELPNYVAELIFRGRILLIAFFNDLEQLGLFFNQVTVLRAFDLIRIVNIGRIAKIINQSCVIKADVEVLIHIRGELLEYLSMLNLFVLQVRKEIILLIHKLMAQLIDLIL